MPFSKSRLRDIFKTENFFKISHSVQKLWRFEDLAQLLCKLGSSHINYMGKTHIVFTVELCERFLRIHHASIWVWLVSKNSIYNAYVNP